MINVTNKLLKAWYELLSGNISVPVYMIDAPASEEGDYVLVRPESGTKIPNAHAYRSQPVIIVEIVTRNKTMIDYTTAGDIDTGIGQLVYDDPATHNLPAQDDIQISRCEKGDQTYLPEDDGTNKHNRIITRWLHVVEELVNQS